MLESMDTGPGRAHLGEALHALLDGELGAADEADARAHLSACEPCRGEHAKLAAAVGTLHELGRARAPMGFASRVLRRVRMARRHGGLRPGPEHKVHYEGGIIVLLAAGGAAAILAYGVATQGGGLFARHDAAPASATAARP